MVWPSGLSGLGCWFLFQLALPAPWLQGPGSFCFLWHSLRPRPQRGCLSRYLSSSLCVPRLLTCGENFFLPCSVSWFHGSTFSCLMSPVLRVCSLCLYSMFSVLRLYGLWPMWFLVWCRLYVVCMYVVCMRYVECRMLRVVCCMYVVWSLSYAICRMGLFSCFLL